MKLHSIIDENISEIYSILASTGIILICFVGTYLLGEQIIETNQFTGNTVWGVRILASSIAGMLTIYFVQNGNRLVDLVAENGKVLLQQPWFWFFLSLFAIIGVMINILLCGGFEGGCLKTATNLIFVMISTIALIITISLCCLTFPPLTTFGEIGKAEKYYDGLDEQMVFDSNSKDLWGSPSPEKKPFKLIRGSKTLS